MSIKALRVKRNICALSPSRWFQNCFFICAVMSMFGGLLHAQDLRVKIVNGRNGKPVTNECINVWVGPVHGASLLAPTNEQGIAVLHLSDKQVTANAVPHPACARLLAVTPKALAYDADTIVVAGDFYVNCEEYAKIAPGERVTPDLYRKMIPSYSIKKILESGVTAPNTCGKFRAEAKPGELIFFVRPRTFLERMGQ